MAPGQVVDGGHQRTCRHRYSATGGVYQVGPADQPVDTWPAETVPGLVEDTAGQGRVDDRDGRLEVSGRWVAVTGGKPDQLMIDATHLKAHRTAASLLKKGMFPDVSDAPRAA